jgi:outer membrane protein assembly factor BamB
VVRTGDYRITAFDAASGERRWSIQRPGPALALRAHAELLISDGLVYAGLPGGRLLAIQASTGVVRYESVVATPRGANELERIADVVGAPKRDGREVCAVAHQGRLACFDAASGSPTWARDFSSSAGMALDPRFAFASSDIGVVHGFSRAGGVEVWRQDGLRYRSLSAPVSTGRAVAVGDFEGVVHFLDRDTGQLISRQATDGSAVLARPVATSAGVLLQTRQSTLWHIAAGQ